MAIHEAFIAPAIDEWKKLPKGGKIAVAGLFVAVAAIGYYEYSRSKSQGQNAAPLSGTDTTGTSSQYPTAPGGNTGQVPILPGNVNPIFDAAGNLVAFGPTATPTTTPTPTPTPKPSPVCPAGMHLCSNPVEDKALCCGGTDKKPTRFSPAGWTPPKTSSKTTTGKSGGPEIHYQRYHVDENGHMRTVRHINQSIQEDERSYTVKSHSRIMPPELR